MRDETTPYSDSSLPRQLVALVGKMHRKRRLQLGGVLVLTIVCSALEVLSIGALVPLVGLLSRGEEVSSSFAAHIPLNLRLDVPTVSALFVVALLLAATVRVLTNWLQARLGEAIGIELGTEVLRRTMYQSYLRHVSRNSSEIIAALTSKMHSVVTGVIAPTLLFAQGVIIGVVIAAALVFVDWRVATLLMALFACLYGSIIAFTRRRLAAYSIRISAAAAEVVKVLQESLGGIRDVLIDGTHELYIKRFTRADSVLRRTQANILILNTTPRYLVETLGMVALCIVGAYWALQSGDRGQVLPLLGAFALGAQRLLPNLQQAYANWVVMRSNRETLADILMLVDQPLDLEAVESGVGPIAFDDSLQLRDATFCYPDRTIPVLDHLTFSVRQGQRVGIVGATGSGKSTLLDLLMGLLPLNEGEFLVDGTKIESHNASAWRRNLAHVPQVIYLQDASILENIALGVPRDEVDVERVVQAANAAQLSSTIESWTEGYETIVGERGIRLSGGQRQRIGIARALYKQAHIIVFDEATSALDAETESSVIEAIDAIGRDVTVITVAHRTSTLRSCDVIYELASGRIVRQGTYQELYDESLKGRA